MIPKTIHYCWFGGKPLPEDARRCIDSWEKFFPDYEIKRWDESNFDVTACAYTKEAYEAKNWAFVSDYARFWILYHEGGLYFDTDVEVIRDFTPILEQGAFMGCESNDVEKAEQLKVAPGLGLGAEAGLPLYKEILTCYENARYYRKDGSRDPESVVYKTTRILESHGFDPRSTNIQCLAGVTVYPQEYFGPMDYQTGKLRITENTYSIHHYTASWLPVYAQRAKKIRYALGRCMKQSHAEAIADAYTVPFRAAEKLREKGLWNTLKFAVNRARKP